VTEAKGLNLMQRGVAAGVRRAEASAHPGVFAAAEDCLLLALVARKPLRRRRRRDGVGHQLDPGLTGLQGIWRPGRVEELGG
jgi:hypothetical protein